MVRRTRGSGPSNGSRSPASSAHARCGAERPGLGVGERRSRCRAAARGSSPRPAAAARIDRLETAGRQSRLRPVGRRERGQVAVEPRRVPAPARPVERVRPRPDRLVRASLPVGEVVAALVPRPRPVRDLVATEAGRGEALDGDVVLRGRPVVVLLVDRLRPPATRARAASAGGRRPARSAPPHPGRRGSARRPTRGPARARAPRPASPPRSPRPARGRRTAGRATPTRCPASRASATAASTSRGRCRRPSRRSSPSSNDCAPSDTRVTPASTSARASPRSSGPGFASIVTSASAASPNRVRTRSRMAATDDERQQRRGAAAEVQRVERRPPRPERSVGSIRPQVDLRQQRADESLDAGPGSARRGPRVHDEVAVRAQRDAERHVDVERDRRPRDDDTPVRGDGRRATGRGTPRRSRARASPSASPAAVRPPRSRCPWPSAGRSGRS